MKSHICDRSHKQSVQFTPEGRMLVEFLTEQGYDLRDCGKVQVCPYCTEGVVNPRLEWQAEVMKHFTPRQKANDARKLMKEARGE